MDITLDHCVYVYIILCLVGMTEYSAESDMVIELFMENLRHSYNITNMVKYFTTQNRIEISLT